jgi:ankyrin repeat protein
LLQTAAEQGHYQICKYLIEEKNANVNSLNCVNTTPLYYAATNGHYDICKLFIEHGARVEEIHYELNYASGMIPLRWAARFGHLDVCKLLIDSGANVDAMDSYKWTALHAASDRCFLKICELLLDRGADISRKTSLGRTALYLAIQNGNDEKKRLDLVKLLVKKNANVNDLDKYFETPLMLSYNSVEITRCLLESGAYETLDRKNTDGETALSKAVHCKNVGVVEMLLRYGAEYSFYFEIEPEMESVFNKDKLFRGCLLIFNLCSPLKD